MQVHIFKNPDLNNLLVDYCQVRNIVKFDSECYIIRKHNKVYKFKTKNQWYSYNESFYENNNNVKICRQYIQTVIKNIHKNNKFAFRWSCGNGHLEVAKWLWSLNCGIYIHTVNELAFRYSCENGHLEVAKWLWSLNCGIDIHAYEKSFRFSCKNGHLEVVQWLWSLNQCIDIHVDNEFAFKYSCENGHLEVVKFLWSLNQGIDIHVNNEFAFRYSCSKGHLPVVVFLITIYKQQHNTQYLEILNNYPDIKYNTLIYTHWNT